MGLKEELRALLEKYNVSIEFNHSEDTDTHGIRGERIEIVKRDTHQVVISNRGFDLSAFDLD